MNKDDASTPAPSASPRSAWFHALTPLAIAVLTAWAFNRIHTLVTGQDPRTFIVLARQIAEQHFAFDSIREVARFVIPGYPLLLAAVIAVFDIHAAFFVNSFLFTGMMWMLYRIFIRLGITPPAAATMTLFCLAGLFAGDTRNAHFLLLSFRNTPIYTCTLGAAWAVLASRGAEGRSRPGFSTLAALLLCAGCAIRETVVFMIPVLGALLLITHPAGARRRATLAYFAPFALLAAAALLALLASGGSVLNSQSRQMLLILPSMLHTALEGHNFREMAGFLGDELGITGALLTLVGLWQARRRPAWLVLFLTPAVMYFLFYCGIKAHRRFFLTTLFFLLPLTALGLHHVVDWARRAWSRRGWRGASIWATTALLVVLAWNVYAIRALTVWGVNVTHEQIVAMAKALNDAGVPESEILVDRRTRYLIDALTVFTDYRPIDAAEPDRNLVQQPPLAFIEPMNQAAIHRIDRGLEGREAVLRQGRLESTGQRFVLDDGAYEIGYVKPWTTRRMEQTLPVQPSYPAVLRIELPTLWTFSPDRTTAQVRLDDQVVLAGRIPMGAHYLVVNSPGTSGMHRLTFESDDLVPDDLRPHWQTPFEHINLNFGAMMAPSHDHLLSPDFFLHPSPDQGVREVAGSGSIRMPLPYPSNTYLIALMGASSVHDEEEVPMRIDIASGNRPLASAIIPSTSRMQAVLLHLGLAGEPSPQNLDMTWERLAPFRRPPADARGYHVALHNLILYPYPVEERFSLELGARGDLAFVTSGFWKRERMHGESGRWTTGKALLHAIVAPNRRYEIAVQYIEGRPASAPPALPLFTWNGRDLDMTKRGDDRWSALIPAEWTASASNELAIVCTPWQPVDAGSPRELGIFLQKVEVAPAP